MKSKQFNIFQESVKSVTTEDDELYITGIANTGERDLVGDIVTETALQEIATQAINRNLHFNHNGNYDDTLSELTESIIGVITSAEVVDEGVEIKAKILPKHVEVVRYFLENDVKFGLSISGKAHYVENSWEEIESWDLTEISLVPIPCDQGTMGTVQISKSFNEFIKSLKPQLEDKNMADNNEGITIEDVQELINTAFNEKEEELLEQIRGELKEEYEAVINEMKERIETMESQLQDSNQSNGGDGDGEGEGSGTGEGKGEGEDEKPKPEEEDEEEEKRINSIVEKRVETLMNEIFGKHSPSFGYKNQKHQESPGDDDDGNKSYTPREIAKIITGGY